MCAQSIPFLGPSLLGEQYYSSGAYLAFKDSGLFCDTPLKVEDFFHAEIDSQDYSCPVSEMPFEYDDWNPKWYSHLCRSWYKLQEDKPNQNTIGDVYLFINTQLFGLTSCAPIMNFSESKFEAALCMDTNPSGSLSQYYTFDEDAKPQYMLFNQEEDRESNDINYDKDSQFWKFLTQVINAVVKSDDSKYDLFEIDTIWTESVQARLYDNEIVEWGILKGYAYSSEEKRVCIIFC